MVLDNVLWQARSVKRLTVSKEITVSRVEHCEMNRLVLTPWTSNIGRVYLIGKIRTDDYQQL